MSYALGNRIKDLRLCHNISQEKMAEVLETTRQRYARIENGQIDISFVTIKKVADFMGVSTNEITRVVEENKGLTALFREKGNKPEAMASIEKIEKILKVFHAHEKLYFQMKEREYRDD